jgi:maltooligosyltrehalose trehalohydrolase
MFSRLDLGEREHGIHGATLALYRDLLRLRRDDPVLRRPLDGAVLGPEAFVVRWLDPAGDDRLLVVNLGADLVRPSIAEPLLAPPAGSRWRVRWASEHPAYGGSGQPEPVDEHGWHLAGHAAVLLAPAPPANREEPGAPARAGSG